MTVTPFPGADTAPGPVFDIEVILAGIDTMAVQKPVAAQIVSVANSDDTDAKTLARILSSDIALAGRVMKLANSAYFGMRGRVTSLQFAVTVVGFTTVRTMATVALTNMNDESKLPENFWDVTTSLALGSSALAPRFGERPPDALCLGLLAQLGAALLHHNDPEGYAEIVSANPGFRARRAAETRRYGINSLRLTAVALEQWGFPAVLTTPLKEIDDYQTPDGALLRAAFEVAARLTIEDYEAVPITRLTVGRLREDDLVPILDLVRSEAADLKRAMLGQPADDPDANPEDWVF
ncbi:HDOD domain-containing protein [Blastococcus haudaquaticus]|uniref:HDOD domain-containing protein n=1 Tax=Blastococcus haudaquaticus TaxID=1938745 RepID=A0A286GSL0_9ACTN|nr:HDOD domain-containing protein [Blastococcus haudaquaticus]SOD98452.1 HDOD domain-containing protein [Blastococcus haudaquaticus]